MLMHVHLSVRLSLCPLTFFFLTNNQLKYEVVRSKKSTLTTFELFWEGHSAIYDLLELQIQSFLISYYIRRIDHE